MNKKRKTIIITISNTLNSLIDQLDAVCSDEDEARDNIPENLQDSDVYIQSEEASDAMEEANDCLHEAYKLLTSIL